MQRKPLLERLKARAESLRRETYALYLAFREPGVPWYAKAFTALVVGYALSPVDLIPDFIPVLGYLDDLVLIPAGIALARKLIPAQVLADCRARAERELAGKKLTSRWAGAVIILVWTGVLALAVKAIFF
ncbi:MAG TPA: YkvA family protein [Spirochaetales bacterium]|nr:YkvA family protein [Spirochaetales bacterium]